MRTATSAVFLLPVLLNLNWYLPTVIKWSWPSFMLNVERIEAKYLLLFLSEIIRKLVVSDLILIPMLAYLLLTYHCIFLVSTSNSRVASTLHIAPNI